MSEHTVTENLVQRNTETTATLTCSCSLSVEGSLRRKPLRALYKELAGLHEAKPPVREKTERKITSNPVLTPDELRDLNKTVKKQKKSKSDTKVTLEDDGEAKEALEKDEDVNLEVDSNEGDAKS